MLERLSEKFTKKLIQAEIISNEDTDVYVYGFFQTVMMIINIVTTLILGILFQLLIPCILLNFAYIPIRINAGGYHASSPIKCYINSTIIIAVLLSIIKWVPIPNFVAIIILIASSIVILILAPVETENDILEETEKQIFKKRIRFFLIIEVLISIVSVLIHKNWIVNVIALAVFTECIMLIISCLKNDSIGKNI